MISYIIEILIYQTLFLLAFQFFKNEPNFKFNRFYVLISLCVSLALPFVSFNMFSNAASQAEIIQWLEPIQLERLTGATPSNQALPDNNSKFDINLYWIFYIIGIVAMLLWRKDDVRNLVELFSLTPNYTYKSKKVIVLDQKSVAFSFLNQIYIGQNIPDDQKDIILEHEFQHIKHKHSLDIIFIEILVCLFWFNPLLYLFRKILKEIHEYEVDQKITSNTSQTFYINTLLNQNFNTQNISFVHTFFRKSNLKNRIKMISTSRKVNSKKYLIIIPALLISLFISCTQDNYNTDINEDVETEFFKNPNISAEEIKEIFEEMKPHRDLFNKKLKQEVPLKELLLVYGIDIDEELKDNDKFKLFIILPSLGYDKSISEDYISRLEKDINGNKTIAHIYKSILESRKDFEENYSLRNIDNSSKIPFALVDKVPHPSSCNQGSQEEMKACVSEFISNHVNSNFDVNQFVELPSGKYRVSVQFVISRDGYVYNTIARGQTPELEEEAIRVVESLPRFVPGESKGEKVAVVYSLPINFVKP